MYLIPFPKRKPNGQSWINSDGCTIPDVEVATAEVTRDSSSFFFSKVSRTLVGTESGSGCAREGTVVVVVMLLR